MKLSCILSLITICAVACGHDGMQIRKRRNLVYLRGAMVQFLLGFGLPLLVDENSLTMGSILKFRYQLPTNATAFTDAYDSIEERSPVNRRAIYTYVETVIDRLDLDGRACILRAICEAADTTLRHNDLLGEVLHVLLTPSTTSYLINAEYHSAEHLGRDVPGCCHLLYPECKISLLDSVSKVTYY